MIGGQIVKGLCVTVSVRVGVEVLVDVGVGVKVSVDVDVNVGVDVGVSVCVGVDVVVNVGVLVGRERASFITSGKWTWLTQPAIGLLPRAVCMTVMLDASAKTKIRRKAKMRDRGIFIRSSLQ